MVYIEKRVEFTDDLNDNEDEKEPSHAQKLHRRDTPHHLKNKRILNKNNDSAVIDVLKTSCFCSSSFIQLISFSSKLCHIVQQNLRLQVKEKK